MFKLLILLGFSLSLAASAYAESATMPLNKLLSLEPEQVPEKVLLTDLITEQSHGGPTRDAEVYILETIPKNWEVVGKGKLSVSDEYSHAGKKSIRWDWKAGDVLRISNLGMITKGNGYRHSNTFTLSGLLVDALPTDTQFKLYTQRQKNKTRRNPNPDIGLLRVVQHTNLTGTWFELSRIAGDVRKGLEHVNSGFIESMPDGIPEPAVNELVIQAPTDVPAGTIYLDRLIAVASVATEKNGKPVSESPLAGAYSNSLVTDGGKPRPYPEHFTKLLPQSLDAEQQAYIDRDRARAAGIDPLTVVNPNTEIFRDLKKRQEQGFSIYKPLHGKYQSLSPGSAEHQRIEKEARALLSELCDEQADGTYKIKEGVNNSGHRVFFKGDLYYHRKFSHHIPRELSDGTEQTPQELMTTELYARLARWFACCEDSKPVQDLVKAYLDWMKYQLFNAPELGREGNKYSAGPYLESTTVLYGRMRAKPGFEEYAKYLGNFMLEVSGARDQGVYRTEVTNRGTEFPQIKATYWSMFFETDDVKLYAMLENYRNSLYKRFSIHTLEYGGKVLPDYSYTHHGIVSYWGNIKSWFEGVAVYRNGPLDFPDHIHRIFANHAIRFVYGGFPLEGLKGSQNGVSYGLVSLVRQANADPDLGQKLMQEVRAHQERNKQPLNNQQIQQAVNAITSRLSRQAFQYLYDLDWERIPAAGKALSLFVSDSRPSEEVLEKLYAQYPKLKTLPSQTDMHLSFNWSGGMFYHRGLASVGAGTHRDGNPARHDYGSPYWWTRQYGLLMPYVRFNKPLGMFLPGYDWTMMPGTTIPEIKYESEEDPHTGRFFGWNWRTARIANGSLTFNEDEARVGRYGNISLSMYASAHDEHWQKFGVKGFSGNKSYHFYKDAIVALGSELKANTNRKMQTVLFNEMTGVVPWSRKNHDRWDLETPTLVHNSKSYEDNGRSLQFRRSLKDGNYLVSPYGHAYLLPEGQEGELVVEWKERTSAWRGRGVNEQGAGRGVIARIIQNPEKPSSHHFCLLLNADGKSPEELDAYARENLANPVYKVLKQDATAHAVAFQGEGEEKGLLSCIVFEPDTSLGLPVLESANRRINLMMQINAEGNLVVSIADPMFNYDNLNGIEHEGDFPKEHSTMDPRNMRTIELRFAHEIELLEARSGLPESNPDLKAKVEGGNTLTFQTRDGISDTFVVELKD